MLKANGGFAGRQLGVVRGEARLARIISLPPTSPSALPDRKRERERQRERERERFLKTDVGRTRHEVEARRSTENVLRNDTHNGIQNPKSLYSHSQFPLLQSAQASDTAAQLKTHLPLLHW